MPLRITTLGHVLRHIYDFAAWAAIYFPTIERFEADTPCIVALPDTEAEEAALHQACLERGFKNWLNVAVVSDTCDNVPEQTEACLIAAFNDDCRVEGWLRQNMNYRKSDSPGDRSSWLGMRSPDAGSGGTAATTRRGC